MQNCIYEFSGSIYINLTNACSNDCEFCIRNFKDGVSGSELWLEHEPSADEVIAALESKDLTRYHEAVFCGFGEPLCAMKKLITVAGWLKQHGLSTRVNTNGQANIINGITNAPELLAPVIDHVSVSLNAADAEKYQAVCHCKYGEAGYYSMLDFVRGCVKAGIDTVVSVVDCIGEEEVEKCRKIAADLGAHFRVRAMIEENQDY